ncbi:MAG: hypothetical protein AAF489_01970 [Bacteroidota bacterium]
MLLTGDIRYRYIYGCLSRYHHYYEMMCRYTPDFIPSGFLHFWTLNEARTRRVYEGQSLEGLEIFVYEPLRSDEIFQNPEVDLSHFPPVLAFLGTRVEELSDIRTDLNKVGVGLDRYFTIEPIIRRIILDLHSSYGKVVVTGFSLGGCLAQYTALRHLPYIKELVTFQSPKIPKYFQTLLRPPDVYHHTNDQLKQLYNSNTFHYQVAGDSIPSGSDRWNVDASHIEFTPGFKITFDFGSLSTTGIDEHTIKLFTYFTGGTSRERRNRASVGMRDCQEFIRTSSPTIQSISLEKVNRTGMRFPRSLAVLEDDIIQSILPDFRSIATTATGALIALLRPIFEASTMDYYYTFLWNKYSLLLIQNPPGTEHHESILTDLINFNEPVFYRSNLRNHFPPNSFLSDDLKDEIRQRLLLFTYKVRFPEPRGRVVYIDVEGRLTNDGLHRLRQAETREHTRRYLRNPHNEQNVKEIFEGVHNSSGNDHIIVNGLKIYHDSLQFRWREMLIKQEIINSRRLRPMENHVYSTSRAVRNERTVYMIEGISLGRILDVLPRIAQHYAHRLSNPRTIDLNFDFTVKLPGSSIFISKNIRNLKVHEYLSYLIRDDIIVKINNVVYQDEELVYSYFMAHQFYIGCIRKDPLKLLVDQRREDLCSGDINERTGRQVSDPFNTSEFQRRTQDATRPYAQNSELDDEALKVLRNLSIAEWYNFLFAGAETDSSNNRGHKFIADGINSDNVPNNDLPLANDAFINPKNLMDKIPDITLILPQRELVEVIDPTFRFDIPWHNFKTAVYVSVLRFVFPNEWSFRGIDHRDARRSRFAYSSTP